MGPSLLSAPPKWDIRANPSNNEATNNRLNSCWEKLRDGEFSEKLAFLTDTRRIHHIIFRPCTPPGFEAYAGTYRGTVSTPLEDRRAVLRGRLGRVKSGIALAPPGHIPSLMQGLAIEISSLLLTTQSEVSFFWKAVRIFVRFNQIHPYLDGNGRMSRMLIALMMNARDIRVSDSWTLGERPYDLSIDQCFRNYAEVPLAMDAYLLRWFG
jgi:fido (protein-threonine AMPylation protein)